MRRVLTALAPWIRYEFPLSRTRGFLSQSSRILCSLSTFGRPTYEVRSELRFILAVTFLSKIAYTVPNSVTCAETHQKVIHYHLRRLPLSIAPSLNTFTTGDWNVYCYRSSLPIRSSWRRKSSSCSCQVSIFAYYPRSDKALYTLK